MLSWPGKRAPQAAPALQPTLRETFEPHRFERSAAPHPSPLANALYYGDNLPILRQYIPAESVDLVYLDPPFNSNRSYSAIFADESGRKSDAQIHAFDDSWHWGPTAEGHLPADAGARRVGSAAAFRLDQPLPGCRGERCSPTRGSAGSLGTGSWRG